MPLNPFGNAQCLTFAFKLIEMLPKAENLEDLARALNRSPDAISMKLKRMGLQVPPRKREKSLAKISEKKNSFFLSYRVHDVRGKILLRKTHFYGGLTTYIEERPLLRVSQCSACSRLHLVVVVRGSVGFLYYYYLLEVALASRPSYPLQDIING
jgi:hypothetical protein